MGATNIGSSKYPLAKIPAMADPADIQVALKYYHWGQEAEPEGLATAGIAKYLDDIDTRIDGIDTSLEGVVLESIVNAKGDLIVGTASDTVDRLAVGSDGYVLKANSSSSSGVEWSALTSATTSTPGIVQLSDSTSTTSSVLASTPTAVKAAYDLANTANTTANNALPKLKGTITSPFEKMNVVATAAPSTVNIDVNTSSVWYYTSNATANFTINIRADSTPTTLNSIMTTGDSMTVVLLNTNGTTPYYPTTFQIDGSSVTPKWQGGTAPSSGNASSIDAYAYNIIKTASATFTVLASQTKFA